MSKMLKIVIPMIVLVVALIVLAYMTAGINDAGQRTVIQYLDGKMAVRFDPGVYFTWFGKTVKYNDVITFDYDKTGSGKGEATATIDQKGITVRYQDGGNGTVYGKARFQLPNDEETMIKLHKAFRSNEGVAQKLIKAVTEEGMNLTAGLMTSEEAYAEKRSIFTQWSKAQIAKGKFQTEIRRDTIVDESTGKKVIKNVPVIQYDTSNQPMHLESDLETYGVVVSGLQNTDWDFEKKTLEQISTKREATMAIITAKANAERAKQDAITAEEKGKADVMTARYLQEVEKTKAVVRAEQEKEVAEIQAKRLVEVARQTKLEAEQKKLAAAEYKQEQILRGEGDGEYKRLVMKADGALTQKLATYERVMNRAFMAVEKQKWVPEVQMGASGTNGSSAQQLIDMLSVKTAKDLSLDMNIK